MKLRTTCPQCASVFRLTTEQVEAAQGWVQCGVCGAAFDARPTLAMEDGTPLPQPAAPEPEAEAVTGQASETAAAEPGTEAGEAVTGQASETATAERDAAAAASSETALPAPGESRTDAAAPSTEEAPSAHVPVGIARREAADELPSIILIDPDARAVVDLGPLPEIPAAPRELVATSPAPSAFEKQAGPSTTPGTRIEYATSMPRPGLRAGRAQRRLKPWVWASLSAVLALTLLAQAAWFLRDTLVSQAPQLRPLFEQACARLGCTLELPKNTTQLQIIGSDLQTEANGRLILVLTLGNRADYAQAWPMLVLTLTDARGLPLTRRSFAPSEYLGDPQRIAAGLPPLSEQALSLPLSVSGIRPMGFNLKLAY
ncbi:MAG: zinc-ribbon domain-containing protein [Thiobacillaceae bacterium]|jgi:predicted Zn finger-like uncharacterized protein|nr:zinc-ribbon domain-containing protein [Thiobacillaceae bacterium]